MGDRKQAILDNILPQLLSDLIGKYYKEIIDRGDRFRTLNDVRDECTKKSEGTNLLVDTNAEEKFNPYIFNFIENCTAAKD